MMKQNNFILFLSVLLMFSACNSQKGKIIFYPDSALNTPPEQANSYDTWQIIESQNGPENEIPAWVHFYLEGGFRRVETLDVYNSKYIFVGENHNTNFNSLQQWAKNFIPTHDLPILVAKRVEQRFLASAVLYPDDEYGEYFADTIKKISDEEYSGAVKEQVFWIKRQRIPTENEENAALSETTEIDYERYEFFVLISIDKETLQRKIREIMAEIKTNIAPKKEQTAAINKINSTFFEGF